MRTPEEFMATAHPTIGTLGFAFYVVPETLERGKALGLDGFRFYFLGRGGVSGDVEAPVVKSAFGYPRAGGLRGQPVAGSYLRATGLRGVPRPPRNGSGVASSKKSY